MKSEMTFLDETGWSGGLSLPIPSPEKLLQQGGRPLTLTFDELFDEVVHLKTKILESGLAKEEQKAFLSRLDAVLKESEAAKSTREAYRVFSRIFEEFRFST